MSMTITRRGLMVGAAGAGAVVAAPWVARAQGLKSEYKLTVVGNKPVPLAEGAFLWSDIVREKSGGKINIKVYPGSQLVGGDQTREVVALRQGVADMGVFSSINIAPQIRPFTLFQLPFLTPSYKALDAVKASDVGKKLWGVLEERDLVSLAWGENGFREISNSKRAIRKPADLAGMKIRFAAGAIFSDIYTTLGANPVQMSFADLQPALSTGAVDGQENPATLFLALKMDTLAQKHLTVWNYVNDPLCFCVSKAVWQSFDKADQDILRAAAEEAGTKQIALSRKGLVDGDTSTIDAIKARGVEVQVLTPEEKLAFAKATRPVFDKWAAQVGSDLVAAAEAVIAKNT